LEAGFYTLWKRVFIHFGSRFLYTLEAGFYTLWKQVFYTLWKRRVVLCHPLHPATLRPTPRCPVRLPKICVQYGAPCIYALGAAAGNR